MFITFLNLIIGYLKSDYQMYPREQSEKYPTEKKTRCSHAENKRYLYLLSILFLSDDF